MHNFQFSDDLGLSRPASRGLQTRSLGMNLRRGDNDSCDVFGVLQGLCDCDVLVGSARRRVDDEEVQAAPVNIFEKLLHLADQMPRYVRIGEMRVRWQMTDFTRPFLRTPRHTTASSLEGSMKPIDITHKFSRTQTGCHPDAACLTSSDSTPTILGTLGPHTSMSSKPVSKPWELRDKASCAATVDFPTPPFPLRTS
eukprot:3758343-Rhodomonas_salina.1